MKAKAIPDDRRAVIPNLCVENAAEAIEFYKKAFGATAQDCMKGDDGKVMHAELTIGSGLVMISDAFPAWGCHPTKNARLFFYAENVDAVVEKAVKAGCKLERPVEDQFWGDRMGNVVDPYGINWGVATHKEDLSAEEIKKRGEKWMEKMKAGAK